MKSKVRRLSMNVEDSVILVDISEPEDVVSLLKQTVEVSLEPLNQQTLSDYFFWDIEGQSEQYSRKQAGELLANMDEAERQLREYYDSADRNFQIVEGIVTPIRIPLKKKKEVSIKFHAVSSDVMYAYHVSANGFIYGERVYRVSYNKYQSWIYALDRAGITTFFTMNHVQTARLLVAHYQNAQKTEHNTLQRVIKPKVLLKSHDPLVKSLVHLSAALGLRIGETKAQSIKDAGYTSLKEIAGLKAKDLYQVDGIGRVLAKRLIDSLGGRYANN